MHNIVRPDLLELPQIMGSGGGLLDYDNDGLLDIYLVQFDGPDALYRQAAQRRFADATRPANINAAGTGMGVACGDVNADGFPDLLVTNDGPNQLWVNNGDGTFVDTTASSGMSGSGWSTAAAFFDYDGDGLLDLCTVDYVDYFPGQHCENGSGRKDYCGPSAYSGTVDRLYRNLGLSPEGAGAAFEDRTVAAGLAAAAGKGLGLVCRDFNDDGRPDIYVANDMEPNHLWVQQPDGTFLEEALLRGVAVNRLGQAEASMGVISEDFNGDGRFDLFMTHLRGETNTLYVALDSGEFLDTTPESGLGLPSLPFTGFGTVAVDLEHDGDLDLIIVNGRVKRARRFERTDVAAFWSDYAEPNLLFLNMGSGRFSQSGIGGALTHRVEVSRGLAPGDLDNDGDTDFLLTNCGGPARLFENVCPVAGRWLQLRLVDTRGNRDAFGARVAVRCGDREFVREVTTGGGYLTCRDPRLQFGLGDTVGYDEITVLWPDGVRETFPGGAADRFLLLRRGDGQVLQVSAEQ